MLDYQMKREMHAEEMAMKRELHQHAITQGQFGLAAGAEAHAQKMEQAKAKPSKGAP